MRLRRPILFVAAGLAALLVIAGLSAMSGGMGGGPLMSLFNAELRTLRERQRAAEAAIGALPRAPDKETSSRLGWHTTSIRSSVDGAWVQVDLRAVLPLDLIALVPASGMAGQGGGPGYGFPVRFRVEVDEVESFASSRVVSDHTGEDFPNPGNLPVVLPAHGVRARFVRVTTTRPWQRGDDWIVALGELFVISGGHDVAVGKPVRTSASAISQPAWAPANLTDGQSLLGPPISVEHSPTNGYLAVQERTPEKTKWVQVDLGREVAIDEVRLLPARPTDFPDSPGNGFPPRFRVELSGDPMFAQPTVVFDTAEQDFQNPGENPVMLLTGGVAARYVRVTATRLFDRGTTASFALAELQVWSNGRNVAAGAPVAALDAFSNPQFPRWRPEYLVDGFNSRHRLASLSDWLLALDQRRRLGQEIADLAARREAAEELALGRATKTAIGIIVVLAALTIWAAIRGRSLRRRAVQQFRERLARDLHDEIGSQLGSIALAAELAGRHAGDGEASRLRLREIELIARQTNDAMHDIVWLLQPSNADLGELTARLKESATKQLPGLDVAFQTRGVIGSRTLTVEFARHVYLLCKEALANIARHAHATAVDIQLSADGDTLRLSIHDNGVGFAADRSFSGDGVGNMRRRAELLGGNLQIERVPSRGTTIVLLAPIR